MNILLRRLLYAVMILSLLGGLTSRLPAQSVTYDFTQFGATTPTTPLLNLAPDVGAASFRADFTSTPGAGAFQILNFQPNGLFAGNALVEPVGGGTVLAVTLNTAVNLVNLVFSTNGAGALTFACASGTVTVTSTAQSGGSSFPGGILSFFSATPFSSFTLTDGAGPEFAIDNITMRYGNAVPEGGSILAMAGLTMLFLFAANRQVGRMAVARNKRTR